jgi:hypothetical protein
MTGTPYEVDPGSAIGELAADLVNRLAMLRQLVEPTTAAAPASGLVALPPEHECAIAVDGLLGRTGILSLIGGALDAGWSVGGDAGWHPGGAAERGA